MNNTRLRIIKRELAVLTFLMIFLCFSLYAFGARVSLATRIINCSNAFTFGPKPPQIVMNYEKSLDLSFRHRNRNDILRLKILKDVTTSEDHQNKIKEFLKKANEYNDSGLFSGREANGEHMAKGFDILFKVNHASALNFFIELLDESAEGALLVEIKYFNKVALLEADVLPESAQQSWDFLRALNNPVVLGKAIRDLEFLIAFRKLVFKIAATNVKYNHESLSSIVAISSAVFSEAQLQKTQLGGRKSISRSVALYDLSRDLLGYYDLLALNEKNDVALAEIAEAKKALVQLTFKTKKTAQ